MFVRLTSDLSDFILVFLWEKWSKLIDIDVAGLAHRHGGPRFLSTATTNLTVLQMAAKYRQPIINFKSHGGPVSSWIYN